MGSAAYVMKPLRKVSLTRALCRLIRHFDSGEQESSPSFAAIPADVLLAEDNFTNQKVALMMLKRFGCRTDAVSNGEEALDLIRQKHYDLVLMDCQMPIMDGWATAAAIRELEHGAPRVPIIALTANALSGDKERCLQAGMDDYISKPLSLIELHTQLTKWIAPQRLPGG
jgi:two-component system sensor histidine kinase/response regulator